MKLPIKTRILEMAIEKDGPFTSRELSEVLKKEYNNEKNLEHIVQKLLLKVM